MEFTSKHGADWLTWLISAAHAQLRLARPRAAEPAGQVLCAGIGGILMEILVHQRPGLGV
jgi:hypothetical protein